MSTGLEETTEPPLLGRVARAYSRARPRVAAGGANALRGFRFQFEVALLSKLEEDRDLSSARDREVFTEVLSDVVAREAEKPLLVIQTKLRQSSKAIHQGLDELFSIHEVATAEDPDWPQKVSYGLVFRSGDPEKAKVAADLWAREGEQQRRNFLTRVDFEVRPDPGAAITDLLANRFHAEDPRGLREQWIGDLLRASTAPTAVERKAELRGVGGTITDTLNRLGPRRDRPYGIHLLGERDTAPEKLDEGEVLLGQQPAVHHLVEGFFADRPRALAQVRQRFLRWMSERESSRRTGTVPVFWIGGRSGAGKSVLLLQFLSTLRQENWDPILWLGNKSQLLPEATRWMHEWSEGEAPPLIGLDDPYSPSGPREESWGEFLALLGREIQTGNERRIPILVCCGPTEQVHRLQREFTGELEIELFELPPEPREELDELRSWYQARTGVEAADRGEENVLLVQLFFEWGVGESLRYFADHFRQRIEDADESGSVLPVLAEMLALNRLYVGLPSEVVTKRLSPEKQDLLERLKRERHLEEDEGGRLGVWLAHPHLANGIYNAWFPPETSANERREHFKSAAIACLVSGASHVERWAPLVALVLEASGRGYGVAHRIDERMIEALPALYEQARTLPRERRAIGELAHWIEIERTFGVKFEPPPAVEALPLLTGQATRIPATGRLCEMLLDGLDRLKPREAAELQSRVENLLREDPDWPAWGRVAAAALENSQRSSLTEMVRTHLTATGKLEVAGWVMRPLLRAADEEDLKQLRESGLQLLRANPRHSSWSWLWAPLWEHEPERKMRDIGLLWLRSCPDDPGWSYVWREIRSQSLKDPKEKKQTGDLAEGWLKLHPDNRNWGGVWTTLWETDPREGMPQLARKWLNEGDPNDPPFSYVWSYLWKSDVREQWMQDLGTGALRRINDSHPAWGHLFPSLYRYRPGPGLRGMGLRWLRTAPPDAPAWGHVLPALWAVASENNDGEMLDELESPAYRFLGDAGPEHAGWIFVFNLLLSRRRTDRLRQTGFERLESSANEEAGKTQLWERLWEDAADPEQLQTWAAGWLGGAQRHPGWPFVWRRLSLETAVDPEHLERGEAWLMSTPLDQGPWGLIFPVLWLQHQTPQLRARALEWVERQEQNKVWDIMWRHLWAAPLPEEVRERLRQLGLQWLRSQMTRQLWPVIWTALWADSPSDDLRQIATGWLNGHGAKVRGRTRVRQCLADPEEELGSHAPNRTQRAQDLRNALAKGEIRRLQETVEFLAEGPSADDEASVQAWVQLWSDVFPWAKTAGARIAASKWLEQEAESDPWGFKHVWHELWGNGPRRGLFEAGCTYLSSIEPGGSGWLNLWLALWEFEATPRLYQLGSDWLNANQIHPRRQLMQKHLAQPRLS